MGDIINNFFALIAIMLGICLTAAFISIGYIMGFRTCQKSYKDLISSFEKEVVNESKRSL